MALKDWVASETVEGSDMQALSSYLPDALQYCLMPTVLERRGNTYAPTRTFQFDIECLHSQFLGVFFEGKGPSTANCAADIHLVTPSGKVVATMQGDLSGISGFQSYGGYWDLRAYATGNCRVDMRGSRATVKLYVVNLGNDGNYGYMRRMRLYASQSNTPAHVGEAAPAVSLTIDIPP